MKKKAKRRVSVPSDTLLACPFCGKPAWATASMLGIHCSNVNCNATLLKGRDGETDESLVARWNTAPRKANTSVSYDEPKARN